MEIACPRPSAAHLPRQGDWDRGRSRETPLKWYAGNRPTCARTPASPATSPREEDAPGTSQRYSLSLIGTYSARTFVIVPSRVYPASP